MEKGKIDWIYGRWLVVGLFGILITFLLVNGPVIGQGTKSIGSFSATEALLRSSFLDQRLLPLDEKQTSEEESRLLLEALTSAEHGGDFGIERIEEFLSIATNSTWTPALDLMLGQHYYRLGRYSLALNHLELSWLATKAADSGNAKRIGDAALDQWSRLLASLGRIETLHALAEETRGRILDRGVLSTSWARTREALAEMQSRPGISYKCGTFALNAVASQLYSRYDAKGILDIPSPPTGFSMAMLSEISSRFGLRLIPIERASEDERLQ